MIAESAKMRAVLRKLDDVARYDVPVHLSGETGTGKELAAKHLHRRSLRNRGAFVAVNCGALAESLLEAELFGHTRGAFTGAHEPRPGLFAEADGGTLFLDEVAELTPRAQTTLLRVLQEKTYRRVGEPRLRRSNFRLISASHQSLSDAVETGRFRPDLLFRLRVVHVQVPPLSERPEDILPLARHFLERVAGSLGLEPRPLGARAGRALLAYRWPGNVRELENEMVQALVRAQSSTIVGPEHLSIPRSSPAHHVSAASRDFEKQLLATSLAEHGGNRSATARALGLSRQGLYKKIKRLGIIETR